MKRIGLFLALALLLASCEDKSIVTSIQRTDVQVLDGNIVNFTIHIDQPYSTIDEYGVLYSTTNTLPTFEDEHASGFDSNKYKDEYSLTVFNMKPETEYMVRPYCKNPYGVIYGEVISVITGTFGIELQVKTVNTTASFAVSLKNHGTNITEFGVVYSDIHESPDLNDARVSGTKFDTDPMMFSVEDLKPNTKYWARPYCINETGTIMGDAVTFLTGPLRISKYLGTFNCQATEPWNDVAAHNWSNVRIYTYVSPSSNTEQVAVEGLLFGGPEHACFTAVGEYNKAEDCIYLYGGATLSGARKGFGFANEASDESKTTAVNTGVDDYYALFQPVKYTAPNWGWPASEYVNYGAAAKLYYNEYGNNYVLGHITFLYFNMFDGSYAGRFPTYYIVLTKQ